MSPAASATRTLSTAEQRREDVLRVAMKVFGERGLYGTPTMDIARAAGISQAYLFRLFPTKEELFVAVLERSTQRIHDAFVQAAARARADGEPVLEAMGATYSDLIRDPEVLLTQLQGQAAAGEPAVRRALRRGFATLLDMVERESGADPEEIQRFFAHGMLCNLLAATEAEDLHEHWAEVLASKDPEQQ